MFKKIVGAQVGNFLFSFKTFGICKRGVKKKPLCLVVFYAISLKGVILVAQAQGVQGRQGGEHDSMDRR